MTTLTPQCVTLEVTHRCHLDCEHCYLRKDADLDELSVAEIEASFVPYLRDHDVESLVVTGGEPLLRRDLESILEVVGPHVEELRLLTTLAMDGAAARIEDTPVDCVNVSLDGPRTVHDAIRNRETFETVVDNLATLEEFDLDEVYVNCVVSPQNQRRFPEVVEAAGRSADKVGFQFQSWASPEAISASAEVLGCDEGAFMLPVAPDLAVDPGQVSENVAAVRRLGRESDADVLVFPDVETEAAVERWYRRPDHCDGSGCSSPYEWPIVGPTGDVFPCIFIRIPLGNLREDPLETIWNDERVTEFRRTLSGEGLVPVCNKCSCKS